MLLTITSIEIQYFIIAALFAAAAFYVGRMFWRSFFARGAGSCPKGCGTCSAIDVDALQRTIEKRQAINP